jgi:HPt (histidine-containing phosphotransfer) domain-containing protein
MDAERQEKLKQLLAEMWQQNRPLVQSRVEELEAAVAALDGRSITELERRHAEETAHKLAGAFGTYGLSAASLSARDLEVCFAEANYDIAQLRRLLQQVRAAVEQ